MTYDDAAALPEPVRTRLVSLVADALPKVTPLPPALRRVASFAPARRARLGSTQILAALAEEEFRHRVGTQVAAGLSDLALALRPGGDEQQAGPEGAEGTKGSESSEQAQDPVMPDTAAMLDDHVATEVAALAWLLRPDHWEQVVKEAVGEIVVRDEEQRSARDDVETERLRARLAAAEQELRDERTQHKQQLDEQKAENTLLRRRLGESRQSQRAAEESADEARAALDAASAAAATTSGTAEAELRRARARIAELEAALATARRGSRTERDAATVRARLLLDTLLDSAQGLRRELGLPAVEGTPGERVEAELEQAGGATARATSAAGSLGPGSASLLESYLALPRARLIIDGYNVSKSAWPTSTLEAQRVRLLQGLAALVARTGAETTVVFDAADSTARPPVHPPRGVKVFFSPYGVIADDVIRDLVEAEPGGRVVVVVTGDQEIVRDVRRTGARAVDPSALLSLLNA